MIFPQLSNENHYTKHNYASFIGQKFGKWKILSHQRGLKNPRIHFECVCDCGEKSIIQANAIFNGNSRSCKYCAPSKHGFYKSPTWNSWSGAKNRCNNKNNKDYDSYGGRGIKFAERWNDFANFLADMGEKPPHMTLDRINNNGNYEPGNCRWTTYSEQNKNQRKRVNGSRRLPLFSLN